MPFPSSGPGNGSPPFPKEGQGFGRQARSFAGVGGSGGGGPREILSLAIHSIRLMGPPPRVKRPPGMRVKRLTDRAPLSPLEARQTEGRFAVAEFDSWFAQLGGQAGRGVPFTRGTPAGGRAGGAGPRPEKVRRPATSPSGPPPAPPPLLPRAPPLVAIALPLPARDSSSWRRGPPARPRESRTGMEGAGREGAPPFPARDSHCGIPVRSIRGAGPPLPSLPFPARDSSSWRRGPGPPARPRESRTRMEPGGPGSESRRLHSRGGTPFLSPPASIRAAGLRD